MKSYKSKMPEFYIAKRKGGEAVKCKITNSKDCVNLLREVFEAETLEVNESFIVIYLNRANNSVGWTRVSSGGICSTTVDVRMIMKVALDCMATSMILAHNHPSGELKPSQADKSITKKVQEAARFFDVSVLDHIILTAEGHSSMADDGLL